MMPPTRPLDSRSTLIPVVAADDGSWSERLKSQGRPAFRTGTQETGWRDARIARASWSSTPSPDDFVTSLRVASPLRFSTKRATTLPAAPRAAAG